MKILPVAFSYLDHNGEVCYTSNMEGPLHELEAISRYGRKGAMVSLITEQQHRAATIVLLGNLKRLLDNPEELQKTIDESLKENMR